MLIRRAEVAGRAPLDVRIEADRIAEVAHRIDPRPGEPVLDAEGGALIPGLHDHHIHLLALAAAQESVPCGPPQVVDAAGLARALREANDRGEWIRGIGYHESVAGDLDRDRLDALVADRPVRIQHRSGAAWFVNSAAVERLGLDRGASATGIERDANGRATGRLFRCDELLRRALAPERAPSLATVGRRLAGYGVTGLTDATPTNGADEIAALTAAAGSGELPQRLWLMGPPDMPQIDHPRVRRGCVKIVLDEPRLPGLDELSARIAAAHERARAVAVHCVTRAELVLAVGALAQAGAIDGDRIEHAAVAPPEIVELLAGMSVTVVTQPGFIRERGDSYLADVDERDRRWLYRCRGLVDAGIPLGGSTDAPFGDPDPWLAVRTACDRQTLAGVVLKAGERLDPERALALFLTPAETPGGQPRQVAAGSTADLCLLDRPWARARDLMSSEMVRATFVAGRETFRRESMSG